MIPVIKKKIETGSLNGRITLKLYHWAYYISFGKPNIFALLYQPLKFIRCPRLIT